MKNDIRAIKKVIRGKAAVDGAGVHLVRLFGRDETSDFDPFLLLDAFDSTDPQDYLKGFPWHPHRGIETITYLIQGDIEHGDSLGNKGSILDGDCQWMTAGSGIIHQEMPKATQRLLGCQIWLNMPAKDKLAPPQYNDILSENVPVISEKGARVRIIAGDYKSQQGAFYGQYVAPLYLDVEVAAREEWSLTTSPEDTLFIYILSGEVFLEIGSEEIFSEKSVVLFDNGERLWAKAGDDGVRFLLLSGEPLNEPVAWGGPIVMNTKEELNQAFADLRNDTFIT